MFYDIWLYNLGFLALDQLLVKSAFGEFGNLDCSLNLRLLQAFGGCCGRPMQMPTWSDRQVHPAMFGRLVRLADCSKDLSEHSGAAERSCGFGCCNMTLALHVA